MGKGALALGMCSLGGSLQEKSQSQGDWASQLDSSIRRQSGKSGGLRDHGLSPRACGFRTPLSVQPYPTRCLLCTVTPKATRLLAFTFPQGMGCFRMTERRQERQGRKGIQQKKKKKKRKGGHSVSKAVLSLPLQASDGTLPRPGFTIPFNTYLGSPSTVEGWELQKVR